jgi:hypothetical protein
MQIAALNGQTWTSSLYAKIVSNTNPANSYAMQIGERNVLGSSITAGTLTIVPTTTLQRFTYTRTNIAIPTAFVDSSLEFAVTNGATYDFTIRIAQPQMELGAYATTPIFTTGSATATRVADSFSRNNIYTNGLITSSGGTWFVELRNTIAYLRDNSSFALFVSTSNNGFGGDGFIIYNGSASSIRPQLIKFVGGSADLVYSFGADNIKLAIKWDGSTADVFANGTKVVSATSYTGTLMQFIGNGNQPFPIFIQQMALFPSPLSDTDCTTITTL